MTDHTKPRARRRMSDKHRLVRDALRLLAVALLGLTSLTCAAQDANDLLHTQMTFNIPAQPLGTSLKQLATQAGVQILFEEEIVSGRQAPALTARETPLQALTILLRGTGLEFTSKDGTVAVRRKSYGLTRAEHPEGASDTSLSAGSDDKLQLEEVIVTAQHRAEKLQDVPMGITAMTGESLDRQQARSFEDYVARVPGLALQHPSLPGSNTLTLRGLNAGGVGSTVSVYVDDSPFGSSSSVANGGAYAANFDPWDMQRIEVLRGPQGTLYGASSEGGLIKFVTNAPDPAGFSGVAEVSGEKVAQGGNGWSAKGVINVPLGSLAAFRLSTYSESLPGYVDDPFLHQSNLNSGKQDGLRASLLLAPTSNLSIRLTAFDQVLKLGGTSYVDVDNLTRQPVYGNFTQLRAVPEPQRFEYQHYSIATNWDLGWANALAVSSYGRSNNKPFIDATYSAYGNGQTTGQFFSQLLGTPVGFGLTDQADTRKVTQELRLQSQSQETLEWEVGAYYTHESAALIQPNDIYNLPDGSFFGGAPGYYDNLRMDSRYKEAAAFASLTYHLSQSIDVQVGGRWARNSQTFSLFEQSPLLGNAPTVVTGRADADKILYSFAPRWHLTSDLMLYARFASGYEAGGPNPLPSIAPATIPRQFKPDSTVNYEAGIRDQLFDRRLSIDLTAFRIDWSKVQINGVLITPTGQFGYLGNGGSAVSQGVEWELGWAPIPDFTLTFTGAYVDAKLTADAPAVGGVSGERLPNSPQWSFSTNAEYARHAFGSYRAFVGGTWSYVGVETSNFSSTNDVTIPPTRMPGYTTGDLRIGLEGVQWGRQLRFSLYAKNVTNKHAIVLFGDSGSPGFPGTSIYNQPRTIGATASVKY